MSWANLYWFITALCTQFFCYRSQITVGWNVKQAALMLLIVSLFHRYLWKWILSFCSCYLCYWFRSHLMSFRCSNPCGHIDQCGNHVDEFWFDPRQGCYLLCCSIRCAGLSTRPTFGWIDWQNETANKYGPMHEDATYFSSYLHGHTSLLFSSTMTYGNCMEFYVHYCWILSVTSEDVYKLTGLEIKHHCFDYWGENLIWSSGFYAVL